jgi:hypothetical protein
MCLFIWQVVKKDEVESINMALVDAATAMQKPSPAVVYTIVNKGTHAVRFLQNPRSGAHKFYHASISRLSGIHVGDGSIGKFCRHQ